MKVQEFIDLINERDDLPTLYSLHSVEYLESELGEDVEFPKVVAKDLYRDDHRWYGLSTNVYQCEDGFVGVRGVSRLFSEQMSWNDVGIRCEAEEYEQIVEVTYKPKY